MHTETCYLIFRRWRRSEIILCSIRMNTSTFGSFKHQHGMPCLFLFQKFQSRIKCFLRFRKMWWIYSWKSLLLAHSLALLSLLLSSPHIVSLCVCWFFSSSFFFSLHATSLTLACKCAPFRDTTHVRHCYLTFILSYLLLLHLEHFTCISFLAHWIILIWITMLRHSIKFNAQHTLFIYFTRRLKLELTARRSRRKKPQTKRTQLPINECWKLFCEIKNYYC